MPYRIVILGAGISGLTYAWYLKKRFKSAVDITILEKSARAGGWIRTIQADEFLFEQGPRSCRTKGSGFASLQLIEDLGLQQQLIAGDASARTRYLYYHQTLQRFPGLFGLPFSSLTKGLISALWREYFTSKGSTSDESVYDFFSRRLSPELAERLIDPLVSGIYAGDMRQLSMAACFPSIYQWEQEQGSILKGMLTHRQQRQEGSAFVRHGQKLGIFSLKNGMETIIKELVQQLEADIQFNTSIQSLQVLPEGIRVHLNEHASVTADYVFSTIPLPAVLSLLPVTSELTRAASELPYATVQVINVGYHKQVLTQKGFGYLVPTQENESILGCVWDSSIFPQQNQHLNQTRLSVMMGGMQQVVVSHLSEEESIEVALNALQKHMKITERPQHISTFLAKQAIPQFEVGYLAFKKKLQDEVRALSSRLILSGSSMSGVSLNDCILRSQQYAAQDIFES